MLGRFVPQRWRVLLQAAHIAIGDSGHAASVRTGRPVNHDGLPVPWYTYPAIAYLDRLDVTGRAVFEFGIGASTLYWTRRGCKVKGVDHSVEWHAKVSAEVSADLILAPDEASYVSAAGTETFDIVCIDGLHRDECSWVAPDILATGGMTVFDNSDRHPVAMRALRDRGFIQVDFVGLGPLNSYAWTTSLLLAGQLDIDHPDLPSATY